MMNVQFEILTEEDIPDIAKLGIQLNPNIMAQQIEDYLKEMFQFPTYQCFGMKKGGELVAVSSGWITIRFYCGKQLEVDNVVVDENHRSEGLGKIFFKHIDEWAKNHDCQTIELNTYVQNAPSHKFYFNSGYKILGFHFQKKLA